MHETSIHLACVQTQKREFLQEEGPGRWDLKLLSISGGLGTLVADLPVTIKHTAVRMGPPKVAQARVTFTSMPRGWHNQCHVTAPILHLQDVAELCGKMSASPAFAS